MFQMKNGMINLKRLLALPLLIVLMASGLVVISCGGGDDEDDDWGGQDGTQSGQTFYVSHSDIGFTDDASNQNVVVKCSGFWTATSNASWCTVSPSQGNGNCNVTVSVSKNQTENARNTVVAFQSNTGSKSLNISQSAGSLDACAPSYIGGTITLTTLTVSFRFPYTMEKVKVEAYKPSNGRWVILNDKISGSGTSYAVSPYRDYVTEPVQYGLAKMRVSGYKDGKWGPSKTVVFDIGWNKVYEE